MANSQFTIYSSTDNFAPVLTGTTGSLVSLLDSCLVNGYGNRSPLGWIKPLSNISGSLTCYQQPSGSGLTLFVNDASPNSATGKEAWACGFEQINNLLGNSSGNIFTGSYGNGSGSGQFPTPSQLNVYGHVIIRKSNTSDTVARSWLLYGDTQGFYLFINTGDNPGTQSPFARSCFWFGDIYSFKLTDDSYKCMIGGRNTENTPAAAGDSTDMIGALNASFGMNPHYIARSFTGRAGSITAIKTGDFSKATTNTSVNSPVATMAGVIYTPNLTDNSLYISPLLVNEYGTTVIRGKMRGLWHVCHPAANFQDGQIVSGSNYTAGRVFQILKSGYNGGMFCMEISNTVDTN